MNLIKKVIWHFQITVPHSLCPFHKSHSCLLNRLHIQLSGSWLQHDLLHSGPKFVPLLTVSVKHRTDKIHVSSVIYSISCLACGLPIMIIIIIIQFLPHSEQATFLLQRPTTPRKDQSVSVIQLVFIMRLYETRNYTVWTEWRPFYCYSRRLKCLPLWVNSKAIWLFYVPCILTLESLFFQKTFHLDCRCDVLCDLRTTFVNIICCNLIPFGILMNTIGTVVEVREGWKPLFKHVTTRFLHKTKNHK